MEEVGEASVASRLRPGACSSCQPWPGGGAEQGAQPRPSAHGRAGCCPSSAGSSVSTQPRGLGLPHPNPRSSSRAVAEACTESHEASRRKQAGPQGPLEAQLPAGLGAHSSQSGLSSVSVSLLN